jgi:hypothetical protein
VSEHVPQYWLVVRLPSQPLVLTASQLSHPVLQEEGTQTDALHENVACSDGLVHGLALQLPHMPPHPSEPHSLPVQLGVHGPVPHMPVLWHV